MKRFARSDKLFFLTTFLLGLSLCFNVNLVSAQEREGAEDVEAQIAVGQSDIDLASVVTARQFLLPFPIPL